MDLFSLCPSSVSDIQALLSSVTGISERRVQGFMEEYFVSRKWKTGSFQEATNDLISPPSGTMKPLRCQRMKKLWCWNHSTAHKS